MYIEKYSSKNNNNSDNKTFSICVRSDAGWHIIQPFHSNVYAFVCFIQIFCENRESRFFLYQNEISSVSDTCIREGFIV